MSLLGSRWKAQWDQICLGDILIMVILATVVQCKPSIINIHYRNKNLWLVPPFPMEVLHENHNQVELPSPMLTKSLDPLVRSFHQQPVSTFNSLWPSDAIWWQGSRSTLVQVMACCLTAQTITWTNVELSSLWSSDVHLRAISFEISQPSVTKISLKIYFLRFYWNLPGANELIKPDHVWCVLDVSSLLQIFEF